MGISKKVIAIQKEKPHHNGGASVFVLWSYSHGMGFPAARNFAISSSAVFPNVPRLRLKPKFLQPHPQFHYSGTTPP
jgi:hypothetical protein